MAAKKYVLIRKDWNNFLKEKILQNRLIAPVFSGERLHYQILTPESIDQAVPGVVRPEQPLKFFFFPFQEEVLPASFVSPQIIMGVTACDLAGLRVLDAVFGQGDFKDPNYLRRREISLVISSDCSQPLDVCFCQLVGLHPFPQQGYDLNLTVLDQLLLLEVGTDKGENFLKDARGLREATEEELALRERLRQNTQERIRQINRKFNLPEKIPEDISSRLSAQEWNQVWQSCVQCGSCTNSCPSCVCFFLEDITEKDYFRKRRTWDSCLFPGYARMASGVSPRPHLHERFRNRYACKYTYMVKNFNLVGCTGCGRCIQGCAGKIDKRKVLSKIIALKSGDVLYEPV